VQVRIKATFAAAIVVTGLSLTGAARAGADDRFPAQLMDPEPTGSITAFAPVNPQSSHPDMAPDALLGAIANFDGCIRSLAPAAAKRGIPHANYARLTSGLSPDVHILNLLDAQPEFTKSVWDYLDTLVSEERIKRGREMLAQYAQTFAAAERAYGVDRYVIAAIWGVETKYSAIAGDRSVLRSTATLACIGRRQEYFAKEFMAVLELLNHGDIAPGRLKGSWAGAFGPTQFMPTVYKRYAVDFDGDGRRDIIGSVPDMIGSTANYLKKHGWDAGETWGYEVVVPRNFNFLLADRTRSHTIRQWEHMGLRRANGAAFPRANDKAFLLAPAGARGPAFLMLGNFRTIMRYNPAEAYALAIGHLADRLRGGDAFVQAWPRDERVLSRTERYELQKRLANRGYGLGEPDGQLGTQTRTALRHYQASVGLVPDGFASSSVLEHLRSR
jgi:lytic murein transglycosylase